MSAVFYDKFERHAHGELGLRGNEVEVREGGVYVHQRDDEEEQAEDEVLLEVLRDDREVNCRRSRRDSVLVARRSRPYRIPRQ